MWSKLQIRFWEDTRRRQTGTRVIISEVWNNDVSSAHPRKSNPHPHSLRSNFHISLWFSRRRYLIHEPSSRWTQLNLLRSRTSCSGNRYFFSSLRRHGHMQIRSTAPGRWIAIAIIAAKKPDVFHSLRQNLLRTDSRYIYKGLSRLGSKMNRFKSPLFIIKVPSSDGSTLKRRSSSADLQDKYPGYPCMVAMVVKGIDK